MWWPMSGAGTGEMDPIGRRAAYFVTGPDCAQRYPFDFPAPYSEALAALSAIGYGGIELQLRQPSALDATAVSADLARRRLELVAVSTAPLVREEGLALSAADPDVRRTAAARVVEQLEFLAHVAPSAVLVIGRLRGAPVPGDAQGQWERLVEALAPVAAASASLDVTVALEPQRAGAGGVLHTLAEVVDVVAAVGPDPAEPVLQVMLDTFHLAAEQEPPDAVIQAAGDLLRHIHLAGPDREPVVVDDRMVVQTLDALDAVGYDGWTSMEHRQDPDGATAAAASLRAVASLSEPTR